MSDHEQVLTRLLNQIAAERALAHPRIEIRPITSGGANFTTQLFQATISDGDTELDLFAKVAAVGEKFRSEIPGFQMFDTENDFYTKLNKIYSNIQEKHNVPREQRFIPPTCYGCSGKLYEEVIVLENFSAQGYTVYDRVKSVDWDYASKAVEEIAKFHALSIAFEKENKEEFDKYIGNLTFKWDLENKIYDDVINKALSVVKEKNRSKLESFLASYPSLSFEEMTKPAKLNVIIHGDNRVSNHMYRANEDGRLEVKIVDYQTIRGGSPVFDLLYFIFSATDEKFRAQHYERLLDHYYTQLSLAMRRLGLDPDEIFTREDFDYEYKTKLPYGMILAIMLLPVVTMDEENTPKVDMDMDSSSFPLDKTSEIFPERFNGVVDDFIRWGVLRDPSVGNKISCRRGIAM